jgi:hypothetical protein
LIVSSGSVISRLTYQRIEMGSATRVSLLAVLLLHAVGSDALAAPPLGEIRQRRPSAATPRRAPCAGSRRTRGVLMAGDGSNEEDGRSERIDSILRQFGVADGAEGGSSTQQQQQSAGTGSSMDPKANEEADVPWSIEREVALFRDGKGETYEFIKEFVPTFAFFLAIRIAIVEPRYIPSRETTRAQPAPQAPAHAHALRRVSPGTPD